MSVLSYLQTVLRPCQPLCTVLSSLRISPETIVAIAVMDNFVLSFLWLLPLPSEETYAPGKSIKSCDSGDIFFHWFLWEWNEALQWEGYFAFCILFVCWRVYTSTLSLITSLSCQLVAMSVAEGSFWGMAKLIWFSYLSYQMSGIGLLYQLQSMTMSCRFLKR